MRRTISILCLAALLAACAANGAASPGQTSPAAERGQHFAQRSCAGCHAIGAVGESPRSAAPTFATLRMRYNAPQLERRFAVLSQKGHYEMPPMYILPDEGKDLAAYIESLGGR